VDNIEKSVNNRITLWKSSPQPSKVKDMICMKKVLAICSIFFTVCTAFTSCGSDDTSYDSNNGTAAVTMDDDSVGERVSDAIHGAGKAGDDVIEGVTDAAGNIISGIAGDHDKKSDKR